MKKIVVPILLLLCASLSFATRSPIFLGETQQKSPATIYTIADTVHRPFDVLSYEVVLDWRDIFTKKQYSFSGKNTITLRLTDHTDVVLLDAAEMHIDTITINGNITTVVQPDSATQHLPILLPAQLQQAGETIILTIRYTSNEDKSGGLYFFPKGTFAGTFGNGDSVFTPEDLAYTMSEPLDAHLWMPCMDLPFDKAESQISIIVPNGITAASNGALLEKKPYDGASMIWHFKSDRPIATYLMVADASTFVHWGETHHSSLDPNDTVSMEYYAWQMDYDDTTTGPNNYNAQRAYRNMSAVMSSFEEKFGHFPFSKYGQVPAQPFYYGGMEHQSLTTINRSWFHGDEQGMAHEMGHQWFGDKVTCDTWRDIWLNEGFATYSEAVWGESWGRNEWYMNIIRNNARTYFTPPYGTNKIPIYSPPIENIFNVATTYSKGACVLHMLRRMLGDDSLFFRGIRNYTDQFAYKNATTNDLRDFLSYAYSRDLTEYFDQWIYGAEHPIYKIAWGQSPENLLHLKINQSQSVRSYFTMPMNLFLYHSGIVDTLQFINDARVQDIRRSVTFKIDSIGFDDDALILSEYSIKVDPSLAVVSLASSEPELSVQFDKNRNRISCSVNSEDQTSGEFELYTSLGVKLASYELLGSHSLEIPAETLSNGVYFVHFSGGTQSATAKIVILR